MDEMVEPITTETIASLASVEISRKPTKMVVFPPRVYVHFALQIPKFDWVRYEGVDVVAALSQWQRAQIATMVLCRAYEMKFLIM